MYSARLYDVLITELHLIRTYLLGKSGLLILQEFYLIY